MRACRAPGQHKVPHEHRKGVAREGVVDLVQDKHANVGDLRGRAGGWEGGGCPCVCASSLMQGVGGGQGAWRGGHADAQRMLPCIAARHEGTALSARMRMQLVLRVQTQAAPRAPAATLMYARTSVCTSAAGVATRTSVCLSREAHWAGPHQLWLPSSPPMHLTHRLVAAASGAAAAPLLPLPDGAAAGSARGPTGVAGAAAAGTGTDASTWACCTRDRTRLSVWGIGRVRTAG